MLKVNCPACGSFMRNFCGNYAYSCSCKRTHEYDHENDIHVFYDYKTLSYIEYVSFGNVSIRLEGSECIFSIENIDGSFVNISHSNVMEHHLKNQYTAYKFLLNYRKNLIFE